MPRAVALACALFLPVAGALALGTAPLPTEPGPHAVEVRRIVLPATTDTQREVTLRVAYPRGVRSPAPLVVYSHGAQCGVDSYAVVHDHWVSHGYVVIAPAHLDEIGNGFVPGPDAVAKLLGTRLADVSYVVDALDRIEAMVPALEGRLDPARVAVGGHSFGGMIAKIRSGLAMKPFDGAPGRVSLRDERFRAAVIMSGVGPMPQMADDAFAGIAVPLLSSGGTEDLGATGQGPIHPWRWRMAAFDLSPPGGRYGVWLEKGDHYLGGLICRSDRVDAPDPEGARIVAATSLLFLEAYLRGNRDARASLDHLDLTATTAGRAHIERR